MNHKQINVTQNLTVRIVPVNNPNRVLHSEPQGFYRAYVTGATPDSHIVLGVAEEQAQRGQIPRWVGYSPGDNPQTAVANAIVDYAAKFGPLCIAEGV
jgi:hypothetical protein